MDKTQLYIDAIKNATLSKHSIRQYTSKLMTLVDVTKHDIEWIIDHPDDVFKAIQVHFDAAQTRKAYMAAILALFKHFKDLKTSKKTQYVKYYNYYKEVYEEVRDKYRSGMPSDKQKEAYVPWEEVLAKREELAKDQFGSKHHLLLSMYTYIPPLRQDFLNIKLVPKMPFGAKAAKGNFIVLKKSESTIVLNDFKTAKAYKHFEKKLPDELHAIIHKSLSLQPRDYLFVDSEGNPYQKDDSYYKFVSRALHEIFKRPTTVNTLRHSFIIFERKQDRTPGEEEDTARDMLHSVAEKNLYRFNERFFMKN